MTDSKRLLFLHGDLDRAHHDHHRRLPAAFRQLGWTVDLADYDSLRLASDGIHCSAGALQDFGRIWLLGFGRRQDFLDRMQLLATLEPARFVTTPTALLILHGKFRWRQFMPATFAAREAATLCALAADHERQHGPCRWVLKPPAGSFGRGVTRLPGGAGLAAALGTAIRQQDTEGWSLLQRYDDAIAAGEMRALWAADQLIGSYRREPGGSGLNNRHAGGRFRAQPLSRDEQQLVAQIGRDLQTLGVGFAAIDVCGSVLVEVNVANPGGLEALSALQDQDAALAVAAALSASWNPALSRLPR